MGGLLSDTPTVWSIRRGPLSGGEAQFEYIAILNSISFLPHHRSYRIVMKLPHHIADQAAGNPMDRITTYRLINWHGSDAITSAERGGPILILP